MKDNRLSELSIMNIEAKVLNMIEFDDILNIFVDKKLGILWEFCIII